MNKMQLLAVLGMIINLFAGAGLMFLENYLGAGFAFQTVILFGTIYNLS